MTEGEYGGKFFLGQQLDPKTGKATQAPLLYDPDDLTTHGVVVGMTGSGKTGLCIDLLEEAALRGIPALLLDPKGDLSNILLHFPKMAPADFEPWIDPDEARRKSQSTTQAAEEAARTWAAGLADSGMGPERIGRLLETVEYGLYSPGSNRATPISILASLEAPDLDWEDNREALRDRISGTVTALLGLVGIQADPVRSREHILLAHLIERAWRSAQSLDLVEVVRQVQAPPINKLGAFDLDQFFPEKDRTELALRLNSLLASPDFEVWLEGAALDIPSLLWTEDGRPRHSVFYLAHLTDAERMFFVSLLLTTFDAWVRSQPGSSALKGLLFIDDVVGLLPPVSEPPSKAPLIRLLKLARAFGYGVVLATQNPVDLDYKALGNAGTWFIGRLQTEQDKNRLLDGLEEAGPAGKGLSRSQIDRTISSLGKRVFMLHNVHAKGPQVFRTRWAMAYLRGPISRAQLRKLAESVEGRRAKAPAGSRRAPARAAAATAASTLLPVAATPPTPPGDVRTYYLPNNLTPSQALRAAGRASARASAQGLIYRASLLAQAQVRFLDRKLGVDTERIWTALVHQPKRRGPVRWDDHLTESIPPEKLDASPAPDSSFADLEAPFSDERLMKQLEKDFLDHVYRTAELRLPSNPSLKLVAEPGLTPEAFREQCAQAAQDARDAEADRVQKKYTKQLRTLQSRMSREERELAEDQAELSARKMEEMATHGENLLGLIGGRRTSRRLTTSLTKRRMTEQAKADVEESIDAIAEFKRQLVDLEAQMREELEAITDKWAEVADQIEETALRPRRADVLLDLLGVAWFPYWRVDVGEETSEVPAFGVAS
jgi:hypothetical protein